ncbi:MAG: hypothetical protein JKX98_01200 [Alcanivoracaceae bacterium]|nr:hypothetical protein [Alcanivoracaceae bacterium]
MVAQNVSADSSGFGGSGKGKALVAMATTQVEGLGNVGGSRRVSASGLGYRTNEDCFYSKG